MDEKLDIVRISMEKHLQDLFYAAKDKFYFPDTNWFFDVNGNLTAELGIESALSGSALKDNNLGPWPGRVRVSMDGVDMWTEAQVQARTLCQSRSCGSSSRTTQAYRSAVWGSIRDGD